MKLKHSEVVDQPIVLSPKPGEDVDDLVNEMIKLARVVNCAVCATHNERSMIAVPESTARSVKEQWDRNAYDLDAAIRNGHAI